MNALSSEATDLKQIHFGNIMKRHSSDLARIWLISYMSGWSEGGKVQVMTLLRRTSLQSVDII